jgi:PKD repeat protein
MRTTSRFSLLISRIAFACATLSTAACGLDNQDLPTLSGPSGLGLAITMAAVPDQLPRDGSSQSVVTLTARDPQGKSIAGQRLSLSLGINAPQGASLALTEVTTGSGGHATFIVTAPTTGSVGDIMILATPVGGDANNATARSISIAAIPRNNSAPQFPSPAFTVSCANATVNAACTTDPEVGDIVTFNASGVTDEGVVCNSCTFRWNFGGEGTATGQIVTHAFTSGGVYVVTLAVTDAGGITATAQRNSNVSVPGPATVDFTPPAPIAGQTATFVSTSVAAPNHRIVSYTWTWGDGTTQTTAATSIQHTYDQAGTYPVTLSVKDDLGQTANVTKAVIVTTGLVPTFTRSPAGTVGVGQTVSFDGSTSVSNTGTQIVTYLFDFGDGETQSSAFPTAKHEYAQTGTYTVKLTITDVNGRSASTSATLAGASVTVQ